METYLTIVHSWNSKLFDLRRTYGGHILHKMVVKLPIVGFWWLIHGNIYITLKTLQALDSKVFFRTTLLSDRSWRLLYISDSVSAIFVFDLDLCFRLGRFGISFVRDTHNHWQCSRNWHSNTDNTLEIKICTLKLSQYVSLAFQNPTLGVCGSRV